MPELYKADSHGPHLFNNECIPPKWFKIRSPISKRILKFVTIRWLIRIIVKIIPGSSFEKTHQFIKLMLYKLPKIAKIYIEEMEKANIILAIPLMMDLEYATNDNDPPDLPYSHQIEIISNISRDNFGVLCPFFGFDPRRIVANPTVRITEDSEDLNIPLYEHVVEEMGFYGFKFYTKLGIHPWFESPINSNAVNEVLYDFYSYCEKKQIPIIVHCSPGGAYSEKLLDNEEARNVLCHPSAFRRVLKSFPKIRLMLAHTGGDSSRWRDESYELMDNYVNVYGDLAYHDHAFDNPERYFNELNSLPKNITDKIVWGSDWPMIRHTWTVDEFIKPFEQYIREDLQQSIFLDNLLDFLFGPSYTFRKEILTALDKTKSDIPKILAQELARVKQNLVGVGNPELTLVEMAQ